MKWVTSDNSFQGYLEEPDPVVRPGDFCIHQLDVLNELLECFFFLECNHEDRIRPGEAAGS